MFCAFVIFLGLIGVPAPGQSWDSSGSDLYYDDGGGVGVGTPNPYTKLHVQGGSTDSSPAELMITGPHQDYQVAFPQVMADLWFGASEGGTGARRTAGIRSLATRDFNDDQYEAEMRFYTTSNNDASATERLRITQDGDVGVGVGAPISKLDVRGNLAVSRDGSYIRGNTGPGPAYLQFSRVASNAEDGGYGTWLSWNEKKEDGDTWTATRESLTGNIVRAGVGHHENGFGVWSGEWDGSEVNWTNRFRVRNNGKVGIGTTSPNEKLSVTGNVLAEEVIVKPQSEWADFVFEEGYNLSSLDEIESFIEEEGCFPAMPSTESVKEHGLRLGEMDAMLLQKVEELTLYAIEQKKRADSLTTLVHEQRRELEEQREALDRVRERLRRLEKALDEK